MQQDNRDNATGFQTTVEGGVAYIGTNHIYNSSRRTRGIPFQALALPKDYVDRPEIRQQIKSKLIDRSSVSRPGTLVVSAIYGLGGVGKSVMAAALAHDREVQEVCADGVLWVTLGQNPDLLPCLYGWVQALGDYDFNPTTIDLLLPICGVWCGTKKCCWWWMMLGRSTMWNLFRWAGKAVGCW
jgi:NB-ARC domain